ncbi:hypothetical protein GDO86_019549 [Hymenochirus boettgeri]|uniref:Uncharacterized protein n=2 Tax=Hymenochirus boettgeri TaxID=247094 RepID=A0A8T2IIP1_9PIPI|nr:hypothetical protein GDO86_019549 [Hymenochirus boettgeri]
MAKCRVRHLIDGRSETGCGSVKFDEVAVFFSEEEWNFLTEQQRALYMEVMKENYDHLIYLGFEVPVILSLLENKGVNNDVASDSSLLTAATSNGGDTSCDRLKENSSADVSSKEQNQDLHRKEKPTKNVHWKDEEVESENSHENENVEDQSPTSIQGRNLRKRKQYFCHDCEKCFKHSSALEAHRRVHSGDKPHKCDICAENFSFKSELIVHRRKHSRDSTSQPQDVENKTPATNVTSAHTSPVNSSHASPSVNAPSGNIVPAKSSSVSASTPAESTRAPAAQTQNSSTTTNNTSSFGEKPHKCNYCEKRFNDLSILEAHHRIHTGKLAYPCTMCDQSFSKPSLLAAHNNTHKEGKPYQCDQCDKNFNDQSLLVAHKRTHTGEKPHKCSHCNKWFPNRTSLIAHEECHLKPKPYKCKHCEKSFNDKSLLITHEGVHTDTKPFKCTQCPESFFLKTQLIVHQATHAPEKPFPCSQCERSFNKKETLLAHIRVHNLQSVQTQKPHRQ